MRLEITFTEILNRSWSEEKDSMGVPFGIKWLHCELTHSTKHQECIFEEEILRRQRSMIARAIYVQLMPMLRVFSVIKFTHEASKLDKQLTNEQMWFPEPPSMWRRGHLVHWIHERLPLPLPLPK